MYLCVNEIDIYIIEHMNISLKYEYTSSIKCHIITLNILQNKIYNEIYVQRIILYIRHKNQIIFT